MDFFSCRDSAESGETKVVRLKRILKTRKLHTEIFGEFRGYLQIFSRVTILKDVTNHNEKASLK